MKARIKIIFISIFTISLHCLHAQSSSNLSCADCDHVIDKNTGVVNGLDLNIQPGDIIGLAGTGGDYRNLTFNDIIGTEENPVIIKNCDGQAIISSTGSFGVKFRNSKNFKLLGDGNDAYDYGIKISTTNGFFLTFEQFTTDFEAHSIEIAGLEPSGIGEDNGFAGIGIKTSPYQDCDLFTDSTRTAWIMENVSVHDCHIHDVGGEGVYIGHGFYTGRKEGSCSEITYSHSIHHIRIYNNLIEDVGYDGIQIKNADFDCEVYNNEIRNYGQLDNGAHNEGLFIGGGTTGKFYNNLVINGTGHGIQFQGMGNIDIYNNVIANSGDNGFHGSNGTFIYRIPDGYFNIINNTFINSGADGFAFFNAEGGVKRLINNIIAGSNEDIFRKGASLDTSNNIMTQNMTSLLFVDMNSNNFNIQENSVAKDAGIDVSQYGISDDLLGFTRSGLYDIGAYEFDPSLVNVEPFLDESIEIYPNPVNEILNLSNVIKTQTKISVFNTFGQEIYTDIINNSSSKISVVNWEKGVYTLVFDNVKYKFTVN